MVAAKKNEETNALKEVKRLCKEFGFTAGMIRGALAEDYSDDKDILFYGNSHLGFMKPILSKEMINRSIFVPKNHLDNDPIGDIESCKFQSFYFKNQKFTDIESHNCKVLVVVGNGILGDGIFRAFGPLKLGFEGCVGRDISPSLSPTMLDEGKVRALFKRRIKIRFRELQKISTQNLFEHIIYIVCPDLPEKAARFRFGDIFVESKTFINYKHIYMEELQKIMDDLDQQVSFIFHDDKELYSDTGFVKDIYAKSLKWDIHPNQNFYKDSKVEGKLIALINK